MSRADRRDLGLLALLVLAFGLVVAPLLHLVAHAGAGHHHHGPVTPSADDAHGAGALEHQAAAFTAPADPPPPVFFAVRVSEPRREPHGSSSRERRWTPAQPQGP